jgi:hypothetical protein
MQINVLVTQEKNQWIAVGLDHFIVGQGATPDEAIKDLEEQCEIQELYTVSVGQAPFELVPRAPQQFWDLFKNAAWQRQQSSSPYPGELRMSV